MISEILIYISNIVLLVIEKTGYNGVFWLMFLESANIPVPSEVIMMFSGFLAASGVFNIWVVSIVGALGNLGGSLFSYWLGSLVRKNIIYKDGKKFTGDVEKAKVWMEKFGDWVILFSRLLPIVRTFISFPLGIIKVKSIWRFSWLTFAGAFVWSFLLAKTGLILGHNWNTIEIYFRKFDYLILAAIILAFIFWISDHFRKSRNKVI